MIFMLCMCYTFNGIAITDIEEEPKNILMIHNKAAYVETDVLVEIEIINDNTFTGFNFDIPIPDGFEYINGSFMLSENRKVDHTYAAFLIPFDAPQWLRVISYSMTQSNFLGNDGVIATFRLMTPNQIGSYMVDIINATVGTNYNILTDVIPGEILVFDSNMNNISFDVLDKDKNQIKNAVITLGNIVNEPGDYKFSNIPSGTYDYSIVDQCYMINTGTLTFMSGDFYYFKEVLLPFLGDANGDGIVNTLDVISIINKYMGTQPKTFCFQNADMNNDGVINILDAIMLLNVFMEN